MSAILFQSDKLSLENQSMEFWQDAGVGFMVADSRVMNKDQIWVLNRLTIILLNAIILIKYNLVDLIKVREN